MPTSSFNLQPKRLRHEKLRMNIGGKLVEFLCEDSESFIEDLSHIILQLEARELSSEHSPAEFNKILSEVCGTSNVRQMLVAAVCKVSAITNPSGKLHIDRNNLEDKLWDVISDACVTDVECRQASKAKAKWKSRNRSNSLTEFLQLDETSALQDTSHLIEESDDSYNDSFGDQINQFLDAHVSTKAPATDEYADDFEDASPAHRKNDADNEASYGDDFEENKGDDKCEHGEKDDDDIMLQDAFPAKISPVALDHSLDLSLSIDPSAAKTTTATTGAPKSKEEGSIDASFGSFATMEKAWNNTAAPEYNVAASTSISPTATNTLLSTPPLTSPRPHESDVACTSLTSSKDDKAAHANAWESPSSPASVHVVHGPPPTADKVSTNDTNLSFSNSHIIDHTPNTVSSTKFDRPHSAAPQRSSSNHHYATSLSLRPKSAVMHRSKSTNDTTLSRKPPLPDCFRSTSPSPHRQFHTDPPAPPPKPPVPVFRKPSAFVTKLKTITASKYDLNDMTAMADEQPTTLRTNKELFHYLEKKVKYYEQVQPVVIQVWKEKINDALEVSIEQKLFHQREELAALKRQLDSRKPNPHLTQVPSPAEVNRAQHILDKQKEFYFYDDKKTINMMTERHRLEISELRNNVMKPQEAIDTMFAKQLDIVSSAYHRAQHAINHADKLLQQHQLHPTNATLVRAHTAASDTTTILLSSLHHIETEITSLNTTIKALNSDSEILPPASFSPTRVDASRPKSALLQKYRFPSSVKRRPKSATVTKCERIEDTDRKEDAENGIYNDDFEDREEEKQLSAENYSADFDDVNHDNDYYVSDDDSALMRTEAPPQTKLANSSRKVKYATKKKKKLKPWNKRCCSECRKRFRGKGKLIPTALKTKDGIWIEARKDDNMFRGKQTNYLSLLQTQQEPYGSRVGADKLFCTWTCAKQWNNKHTSIQKRYETHMLIEIASGNFKNEF